MWQKSHSLVIETYKFTKSFPSSEKFGLTDQIRRSAVSITSNIAEGFGRGSDKDKSRFLMIARGSANELLNQYIIARDLGFIDESTLDDFEGKLVEVQKMISGLIKTLNR